MIYTVISLWYINVASKNIHMVFAKLECQNLNLSVQFKMLDHLNTWCIGIEKYLFSKIIVIGFYLLFPECSKFCIQVEQGHTVLVHAAAGGVGSILCQWANMLGATVIGTVSTKEKALQAKEDGCHHVIIYKEEDFVTRVNEITSGEGLDVVFDSVGKDTFEVIKNLQFTKS